jgi:hypothetical protein
MNVCKNSSHIIEDDSSEVRKIVTAGTNTKREQV